MSEKKIKLYDTVKDKSGNRYRIVEFCNDGTGHVVAALKGISVEGKVNRGPARKVDIAELEENYTRIDLPEVTVSYIEVPDMNVVKKADRTDVEKAVSLSTYGAKKKNWTEETRQEHLQKIIERQSEEIKALKDRLAQKTDGGEVSDLKKTISKMHDMLAEKDKMIATLRKSIIELKDLCAELGDEKAELANKIEQQDQAADPSVLHELAGAKAANRALMSELDEREDELLELRKKYDITEHKIMGMVELVRAVMEGRRMP